MAGAWRVASGRGGERADDNIGDGGGADIW